MLRRSHCQHYVLVAVPLHRVLWYCVLIVGISLEVWVIFGINNVTVMMHTKIIILIDVASVPSRLTSCKIVLCVGVVVTV